MRNFIQSKAFVVNVIGALNVARVAEEIGAVNVYISMDYVFDGKKGKLTRNMTSQIPNIYGTSKLTGEIFTGNYSRRRYIIRVASLYGSRCERKRG